MNDWALKHTMVFEIFDEALLKSTALLIRFFQLFASAFIVGGVGQFLSDVSTYTSTPQAYVAVIAIAGVSILWTGFAFLLTCFAGRIILAVEFTIDLLLFGAFIASTVLSNDDAIDSCHHFDNKYFYGLLNTPYLQDCNLVKASFAFCILNMWDLYTLPVAAHYN